ncbi:MAG: hypothetical protein RLZZ597_1771 [Cyanobacteriota bacterium]|jgi:hypothetical protein
MPQAVGSLETRGFPSETGFLRLCLPDLPQLSPATEFRG